MASVEQTDMKRVYLNSWTKAFATFLGWSQEKVMEWARQYEQELTNPDCFFYHETAMYYVVPFLIPIRLHRELPPMELLRLRGRLEGAIQGGAAPDLPEDLAKSKEQKPLFEWLPEFGRHRKSMMDSGKWLSDFNVDIFDWGAAKRRVESILSEYGEKLPD